MELNQTDSRYLGDTTVSPEAAALPNLKGYGNVVDLAVAMTDDPTLLGLVTAFKNLPGTTTWTALRDAADDILFRWAGVDVMPADPLGGAAFDTRKLAFLEKYFGYTLVLRDGAGAPVAINVAELVTSWNGVLDKLTIRLAVQGPLHAVFGDLPYDLAADEFAADGPATLADAYQAAILALSPGAPAALAEWTTHWGPALSAFADALVRQNGIEIRTDYAVQSLVKALDGTPSALTLSELAAGLGLTGVQVGTTGADALARGSATGLQVYVAGGGNDTLTGGVGQDVYVFGRGEAGNLSHNPTKIRVSTDHHNFYLRTRNSSGTLFAQRELKTPRPRLRPDNHCRLTRSPALCERSCLPCGSGCGGIPPEYPQIRVN